ncbi:hypothetical protein [Cupriavidus pauculus]|uniref:hypothetical protein n=1 Tax=Cupriavidus pauculus TaxID=82633 RepID=UPI0011AEF07B|nr:hypothetical protein [Cupriavidus pauculus]
MAQQPQSGHAQQQLPDDQQAKQDAKQRSQPDDNHGPIGGQPVEQDRRGGRNERKNSLSGRPDPRPNSRENESSEQEHQDVQDSQDEHDAGKGAAIVAGH